MAVRNFNPQRAMTQFRDEMNRLLGDFLPESGQGWTLTTRGQPALNVWETDEAVMVEAEIPGVKSEHVDISVVGNELTLKVQRPADDREETLYHRRERPVGNFTRVVRLPMAVDADRVSANLHQGVLTVKLPKAESAKPRKIVINGG